MAMTVASNFRGWLRKISYAVIFCVASIATYPGSEPVGYRSPKLSINAAATSAIIETNALPLRVHSDPIYTRSIMAIGAGAIAVIQGKVVILDRVGRLFLYDRGNVHEDTCVRLPMNVAAFEKTARFPLDESTLRAHDLKYDQRSASLFASFESYNANNGTTQFEIARIKISTDGHCVGSWEQVLMGPPLVSEGYYSGRGAGGKMVVDGNELYFAVGDYNLDRPNYPSAQIPDSFYGKTYRYELGSKQLHVLSSGHRVPLGLTLDSRGRLWLTENGPRGGDKLDLVRPGQNYGWPFASLGTSYFHYRSAAITTATEDDFTKPVFAWVPSVAPSQVTEVADFDDRWNGDLIVGSLKGQTLYRLHLNGDGIVYSEAVWLGHKIRDLVIARGQIVVFTDDGALITIEPDYSLLQSQKINIEAAYSRPELTSCSSCHSFSKHSPLPWAPTLTEVFGRPIGGSHFDRYSSAMSSKKGVWDETSLAAFLLDPAAFVPGTTMPSVHLAPEVIDKIIADLKEVSPGY